MQNQTKNTLIAAAIGLIVAIGIVAGICLPVYNPPVPVVIGASQALTNYFRQLVVTSADDTQPVSVTMNSSMTHDVLGIYTSGGSSIFRVSPSGALSMTGSLNASSLALTNTATANGFSGTYLTGTLGTTSQPNVVNLGTQTYFTATHARATDFTATYITGTLGTANQPNLTNLGTQAYLTATHGSATDFATTYLTSTNSALTDLAVGGGYYSTGCTLTSAGSVLCAGDADIAGAVVITGNTRLEGSVTVNDYIDADSLLVAGVSDLTSIKNTGANPITINDDLVVTGTTVLASVIMTPTDGGVFTPTGKLVQLYAEAALGVELGTCVSGEQTVLYNPVNFSIVITDTGNGILAGDQTLGQYDALALSCFGAKWVQTAAVSAN